MAIIQLTDGGSVESPRPGPLRVTANTGCSVRLELRDPEDRVVPAAGRPRADEILIGPGVGELLVTVEPVSGLPFPPGATLGLTLAHPAAGPDEKVVRVPVDVTGRLRVPLVRIVTDGGRAVLRDAFRSEGRHEGARPLVARPWHQPGTYGFHTVVPGGGPEPGPWALVVDGSPSCLATHRRAALSAVLETLFGIAAAARGGGPHAVLRTRAGAALDITEALDDDAPDWTTLFGDRPSPWSRMTPALEEAVAVAGDTATIVLVTDGVPVDAEEVVDWALHAQATLHLVALGRSRREARPDIRPTQWWDEELQALEPLADAGHVLVGIGEGETAREHASDIAAAIYGAPVGVR